MVDNFLNIGTVKAQDLHYDFKWTILLLDIIAYSEKPNKSFIGDICILHVSGKENRVFDAHRKLHLTASSVNSGTGNHMDS